jgi:hypothetical protein
VWLSDRYQRFRGTCCLLDLNIQVAGSVETQENVQNYWAFELCPSSGILETREHNVSGTGSVSVLRGDTYSVGSFNKS